MKNLLKYWPLVAILAALIIGFFVGRANQKEIVKTKTEYVKGETIRDSFYFPEPHEVVKYKTEFLTLPSKKDTIWKDKNIYISERIDTAKIIERFSVENKYRQVLFDSDTLGKFTLNSSVQYNQLKNTSYEFKPVYRTITNTVQKKNTFTPFIGASYNTFNQAGVGAGIFIKNFGVEYKYLHDLKTRNTGHEAGIKIKF